MKNFLTLLLLSFIVFGFQSCTQEITENEDDQFSIMESYSLEMPEGTFTQESLESFLDSSDFENQAINNFGAEEISSEEPELELRSCGNWSSWRNSVLYTCYGIVKYRTKHCGPPCCGVTYIEYACFI